MGDPDRSQSPNASGSAQPHRRSPATGPAPALEKSLSERHFWEAVRRRGLGFACKRQVPVGPYVLDFYFREASLCVETDVEQHRARRPLDEARDDFLAERGIATIRIPTLDLFDPTGLPFARWLDTVRAECARRAQR